MSFKDFNLHHKLLKNLTLNNFKIPTPIQEKALPLALNNKSLICSSKTGSGKTLCFSIPSIHRLLNLKWQIEDGIGVLVLSPTRELSLQTFSVFEKLTKKTHLTSSLIIGGLNKKEDNLHSNIVIATPGRFLEQVSNTNINTNNIQFLILDECDKMIEMGFKEDIEEILDYIKFKNIMLFSATPNSIASKIKNLNIDGIEIVNHDEINNLLKVVVYKVEMKDKISLLYEFVKNNRNRKSVVFFSTCKESKFFYFLFENILRRKLFILNGSMSQKRRIDELNEFNKNKGAFLFCTDVGARGIDFDVDTVLQFDCPESVETYVHRMGRAGRRREGKGIIYLVGKEEQIIEDFQKGKWKKIYKNNENTAIVEELEIKERKGNEKNKEIIKKIIEANIEVEVYAKKYLTSYKRFLELGNKKYFSESLAKIHDLCEYLNVELEEKEKKEEKNCNRKKEKIIFDD